MREYFLDLHVHLGRSGNGKAVKITASRELTLENVLRECLERKGIQLLGIVDCGSIGVREDLRELVARGQLLPLAEGGLRYREQITLFTGVEMEARERDGTSAHYLAFFPTLSLLEGFAEKLSTMVANPQLSTQNTHRPASELLKMVREGGGLFIPAHVFTPHKGLFGACAARVADVFGPLAGELSAFEMGLSADSTMASYLPDLEGKILLSNSDAHSLEKIGREYNKVSLERPTYTEICYLLKGEKGRRVLANYGLDPRLGKYHRSYCQKCGRGFFSQEAVLSCPECGNDRNLVRGVWDRILTIAPEQGGSRPAASCSVPYCYQAPLSFIPGIGKKTYDLLISRFGTEMRILHQVEEEKLAEVVGAKIAGLIGKARRGELKFQPGAGGIYGRVRSEEE